MTDNYKTNKCKFSSYEEAVFSATNKKIKTIVSKVNHDIIPQLIETQRFINSLPKEQRQFLTKVLDKSINIRYKQKARKLGTVKMVEPKLNEEVD